MIICLSTRYLHNKTVQTIWNKAKLWPKSRILGWEECIFRGFVLNSWQIREGRRQEQISRFLPQISLTIDWKPRKFLLSSIMGRPSFRNILTVSNVNNFETNEIGFRGNHNFIHFKLINSRLGRRFNWKRAQVSMEVVETKILQCKRRPLRSKNRIE